MTTRPGPPDPPDPPERPTTPIPRRPQPPRRSQPPRPPAQPWYLEFRRPPVPPRVPPPRPTPPARPVPPPPKPFAAQHRPNRELLIGAGVAGVLTLAVLTLVVRAVVGGSGPVELDVNHAQDGVRQVLTDPIDGYGYEKVADVACNNGVNPRVRKGSTFTCTVTVDGAQRQVLAEFSDDAGTYAVDRPR